MIKFTVTIATIIIIVKVTENVKSKLLDEREMYRIQFKVQLSGSFFSVLLLL